MCIFVIRNSGDMMWDIDCFFCENIVGIIGIILSLYAIWLAKRIFKKSKDISDDTKEAIDEIKAISKKIGHTTEETNALLKAQSLAIAQAKDLSEELSPIDKQTIEAYDRININPQTAKDWFIKGYAAHKNNNYDAAIECYNKAIELDPNNAKAYNNLGLAYRVGKKDYDKAIDYYNNAIELDHNYAAAYNNLGVAYRVGRKDYDKAIECYNKAIELNPNYAKAYNNLGLAYKAGKKDYDKAIECYNKAIELNPNYAKAYNNLGAAYARQGNLEKAAEYYKKAASLGHEGSQQWLRDNNITQ